VIVQFKDDDGDLITIDSKELLERAIQKSVDESDPFVRLYLLAKGGSKGDGKSDGKDGGKSNSNNNNSSSHGGSGGNDGGSNDGDSDLHNKNTRRHLMSELEKNTYFSRQDLDRLLKLFANAAPDGKASKRQFAECVRAIGVRDDAQIDQMFTAFGSDRSGIIDVKEFMAGLSTLYKGTMEERLELAFKAYDLDGNGVVDRNELFQILRGSLRANGFASLDDDAINKIVDKCFDDADLDGDGTLDYDEFKSAVLRNQIVVQTFWRQTL
jgi:Ca2+-binding EF-hand superfamily protein